VPLDAREELKFQKNIFRFTRIDPFRQLVLKVGVFTGE